MGDDFELMLASVDRSISQLRAMRPVALRGPTKFQVSSGSALRKMISRRTFAKCVGSLLAVGLPKVGLAQAIIKTNVAAVNGSTPGLHTNSYSALCSISAITHSYTAGTALSMRGNPDLPI